MYGGKKGGKGGKFSTNALLQKVNSQLRGEKIPDAASEEDDEDDLNAYLNSLSKKKTSPAQPQWDKFGEDDISISDDEAFKPKSPKSNVLSSSGNKFLKKKTVSPAPESKTKPAGQRTASHGRGSQSGVAPGRGSQPGVAPGRGSQYGAAPQSHSGALGKAAMYDSKYVTQSQNVHRDYAQLTDSDMDMNISADEDVLADVQSWKRNTAPKQAVTAKKATYTAVDSDDSSSMQIGRGASKFMKKPQTQPEYQAEKKPQKQTSKAKVPENQSTFAGGQSVGRIVLDTDEESLAEFMGGLSGSNSSRTIDMSPRAPLTPRGQKGSLTPRSPRTPRSLSLEEIKEEDYPRRSNIFMAPADTTDDDEDIKLNIMDLDDLQPAVILGDRKPARKTTSLATKGEKTSAKKSGIKASKKSTSDDLFGMMGLQSVDDLLLGGVDELSVASEIQTAGVTSEIQTEVDSDLDRPTTPLKSILATPRSPKATPRSARGRVRYKLDEDMKGRSRSQSPEVISTARGSETISVIHTEAEEPSLTLDVSTARTIPEITDESDTETYTEDYSDDFSSQSGPSTQGQRSQRSGQTSDNYYSDDFTSATDVDVTSKISRSYHRSSSRESYSEDYTSYTESSRSRTPSPVRRVKKSRKTRSCEVQTGMDMGLLYHWNPQGGATAVLGPQYGMAFVDPTPIATHVVSAEALEAATAYSPSMIALNDLLRQQLTLTRQFVEMQNRIHANYASMVDTSFQYTTLEDTKKYIKKTRRPTITFDEALKQVKAEMGIK